MNNPTRSIALFGVYAVLVGLSFVFIPNVIMGIFGLPVATEAWVNVFGAVLVPLGLYYIQAAREHNVAFYRMSVWGRALFVTLFVSAALTHPGYTTLILFAAVDGLWTLWTWYALRQSPTDRPAAA